jgi:molybdopterin molybdotransferase
MVTFILLVRPALRALQGAAIDGRRFSAVLDRDYEKPAGRAHAVRCRLRAQDDGWHAEPTGAQGSHILTSMLGADALAVVPSDVTAVRAGERVALEPLHENVGMTP